MRLTPIAGSYSCRILLSLRDRRPGQSQRNEKEPLHLTDHLLEGNFEFLHFLLRAHCDTHPVADGGKAPPHCDALGQHSRDYIFHIALDIDQHEISLWRNKPETRGPSW